MRHKHEEEPKPEAKPEPKADKHEARGTVKAERSPFYPYPDTVPAEAWKMAVDALRGVLPDKKEGVHAVMHVASYGLGKWDPDGVSPEFGAFKGFGISQMTPHQLADVLEKAGNDGGAPRGAGEEGNVADAFANLPWNVIVPILIAFVQHLFAGARA